MLPSLHTILLTGVLVSSSLSTVSVTMARSGTPAFTTSSRVTAPRLVAAGKNYCWFDLRIMNKNGCQLNNLYLSQHFLLLFLL